MRYCYSLPAATAGSLLPAPAISLVLNRSATPQAEADRRWPAILRKLTALRRRGRRSIRIVDASCGTGQLLIHAVRRARMLGVVAIEGRGIDRDPAKIVQARNAAKAAADPAIGLDFAIGEPIAALGDEAEFPADIVLYTAGKEDRAVRKAASAAGRTALGMTPIERHQAAA
jgi:SAM-dependent methyltransferase